MGSILLFIHPPLAVLGFFLALLLLFSVVMYQRDRAYRRPVRYIAYGSWFFSLLGLITGMIWAQTAWGSYWSWDPKETLTLLYFVIMTSMVQAVRKDYPRRRLLYISLLSVGIMVLTLAVPFLTVTLHGYP